MILEWIAISMPPYYFLSLLPFLHCPMQLCSLIFTALFPIKHTHMYAYSYMCVNMCTFILIPFSCCVPNFMLPPSLNTNTILWTIMALTSNWPWILKKCFKGVIDAFLNLRSSSGSLPVPSAPRTCTVYQTLPQGVFTMHSFIYLCCSIRACMTHPDCELPEGRHCVIFVFVVLGFIRSLQIRQFTHLTIVYW